MRRFGPLLAAVLAATLAAASLAVFLLVRHAGDELTGPAGTGILSGSGTIAVVVDARAAGSPISPLIYGVAFAEPSTLRDLGATVDRWGGNASTRFNWTAGADNAARDWEFRNKPSDDPYAFISGALQAKAAPIMTIPTIGWVAKNADNGTRSTGVPAGGGRAVDDKGAIFGYDPSRNRAVTSVSSRPRDPAGGLGPSDHSVVYQDDFVKQLNQRFGASGVPYFAMDNEPDAWAQTHTDVHPAEMSYADMLRNYLDYAGAVKDADPRAQVLAPELCCWTSLGYSALDRGTDNFRSHADRSAHQDVPFLLWWLRQVAAADKAAGRRTLDLLSVHFYPQAEGVYSDASDARTQGLRVRATRSLWDSTYTDESWIADQIQLIPRLKRWIADAYPGTGLAITEYSFGGEKDASGAVAQAAALGIFGREGVTLATAWTHPAVLSAQGAAFRLYRNYDGAGSTFGDRSLPARSSGSVAAFAARHSDSGEVDVVLVNESPNASATVQVGGPGLTGALQARYQITPGSTVIDRLPPAQTTTLPPLGMALLRFGR